MLAIGPSRRVDVCRARAIALLVFLFPFVRLAGAGLSPFPVQWVPGAPSLADVSFLLDKPAGHSGSVRVEGDHLVRGDGKRFKIWGINVSMAAAFPDKTNAPLIAARFAQSGINCVRFHYMDRPAPSGLIVSNRNDTQELDPAQLDRLDFFISELKQRGVYADLNLNVGRTYKPGDGVREQEWLGVGKAATYFDPKLIELQKEYARKLLTHRNPYTGSIYAAEPAVALIEFVNENSLIEAWWNGRLKGENTRKPGDVWTDLPPSYGTALNAQFNAWLVKQVPAETLRQWRAEAGVAPEAPLPRLRPEQFSSAARERFETEASFYMEVEAGFFKEMARYLREDLKARQPFMGNSDHGHSRSSYPLLASTATLDVVDGHVYWQHPSYVRDPNGRTQSFSIPNTPMVDDPLNSTIVQLSRSAIAGKPYTVSEVNHPFPNEFACEGIPILAAYGALQDWDGIFFYTFAHRDAVAQPYKMNGHFDHGTDPVKMAQLAAGALIFLRDVRPAARTHLRTYTREQAIESIRLGYKERPYFTPGFPLWLPLEWQVRIGTNNGGPFRGPATGNFAAFTAPKESVRSDTGEISWRQNGKNSGLVTLETEKSVALIGFCGSPQDLRSAGPLAARVDPPFCAITLSSMDSKPIARAGKLLLTTGARVANTGMEWNPKRTSLIDWGQPPTVIEPVTGDIQLSLERARSVSLQPLDGAARPLGPPLTATKQGTTWTAKVGAVPTPWYIITVER